MSDIFISYANEDHDRVRSLAEALEAQGWSVFWDRTIPSGKTWREILEQGLRDARCVVVVWSKTSIESKWVQEEADEGRDRDILHPILIDDVKQPLGFRTIQAAKLAGWNFRDPSLEFKRFLRDLESTLGPPRPGESLSSPTGMQPPEQLPSDMVKVPKGPFLYGEQKTRETIGHDYWIDKFPVTNEKYAAFIAAGVYKNPQHWSPEGWKWKTENNITGPLYWNDAKWNKPDHPMVGVSYYEADAYATWAGKRLPTEQEWEKAARGTDGRKFPWGEEFDEGKCNHRSMSYFGAMSSFFRSVTTPVTQYPNGVSPYGCYDMVGNVFEWCSSPYSNMMLKGRVVRGGVTLTGIFCIKQTNLHASNRWGFEAHEQENGLLGFRLVQDIEP
ncbi:MAG: SUMF1/EgtB/PvdO family nonheme iron enzyme [Nitrospira sp.]|nr:SUMF1/EgtB/PvdO family nonheme iron enzyme [Nitrospira sp.]